MTSAQASRATTSSPTLKVIQLPSPTTGNVSPVDGIGLVMIARPWESAGHGRNTAVPAAASAPRRLRRLKDPRCRIEKLSPRRRQRSITPSYMRRQGETTTVHPWRTATHANTDASRPAHQPKRPRVLLVQPERRILERV